MPLRRWHSPKVDRMSTAIKFSTLVITQNGCTIWIEGLNIVYNSFLILELPSLRTQNSSIVKKKVNENNGSVKLFICHSRLSIKNRLLQYKGPDHKVSYVASCNHVWSPEPIFPCENVWKCLVSCWRSYTFTWNKVSASIITIQRMLGM